MNIEYEGQSFTIDRGDNLLEALLRNGHAIPHSCRAGACQSCLMQAIEGEVPAAAHIGLKDTLKAQKYFLACRCEPESPMKVALPEPTLVRTRARVTGHALLGEDVLELRLQTEQPFAYRAGQYLTVWDSQQTARSYSLASVPDLERDLCLHVRQIEGGRMSAWLHDSVKIGDSLEIQGPAGECFYLAGQPKQDLLLVGTGTGLAPLVGIARDALQQGHDGDIHLIHGAITTAGLYLHEQLLQMAREFSNFHYYASVLKLAQASEHIRLGNVIDVVQQVAPQPIDWKVYLCGDPELVNGLKKKVFLSGASMRNIYADPFLASH